MNHNHFTALSNELLVQYWNAKEADHFRFESGRAWYVAKGGVIVVENDVTAQIPDFLIGCMQFQTLRDWVCHQPRDADIVFRITPRDVLVQCGDAAIALPRADAETNLYGDIEEAIFRPLLTHKYRFKVRQDEWMRHIKSLRAVYPEDSPKLAVVQITITSEGVLLESADNAQNVRVRGAIKIETGLSHHQEVKNKYLLNPFLLDPEPSNVIEISFSENQSKQPSAIMLTYAWGYKLAAIPLWA